MIRKSRESFTNTQNIPPTAAVCKNSQLLWRPFSVFYGFSVVCLFLKLYLITTFLPPLSSSPINPSHSQIQDLFLHQWLLHAVFYVLIKK